MGLICDAYLARAGLKLAVVEHNREIGSGCITEEVTLPGFKHSLHSVAGNDLRLAFLVTCVPTLAIAGLVGIFGARWMKDDIAAAERADKLANA